MNAGRIVTTETVGELIGKKTYHPLIRVRFEEHEQGEHDGGQIVEAVALYKKSLQVIPGGAYRLRFAVEGMKQEYAVRVENRTMLLEDGGGKAA